MKTLKVLFALMACVGSMDAMDPASSSAPDAKPAHVPLVTHAVNVITYDAENNKSTISFTCEQLEQLDLWHYMLEQTAPADREQDIDVTASCTYTPFLRYEALRHLPHLLNLQNQVALERYLDGIAPEEACSAVLALDFLGAPQNIFAWTHAYVINRLINNNEFASTCLSSATVREKLRSIIMFSTDESLPESVHLLINMLQKNQIVLTSHAGPIVSYGAPKFKLSPEGSRLIVPQAGGVLLCQTSDGKSISKLTGGQTCSFNHDGSAVSITQCGSDGCVIVYRASNGTELWGPTFGRAATFSPHGSFLIFSRGEEANKELLVCRAHGGALTDTIRPRDLIGGQHLLFSSDDSYFATRTVIAGDWHVLLTRTSDNRLVGKPIPGINPVFNYNGSKLAVVQKSGEHSCVIALYNTNDGKEIGRPIWGSQVTFSSEPLLGVSREIGSNWSTVLCSANDGRQIGEPIAGKDTVFSADGSKLAVVRKTDRGWGVAIHRTDDHGQIGEPILGHEPVFSPDGSLLAVALGYRDGETWTGLYRTSDGSQIGGPILGDHATFCSDSSLIKTRTSSNKHFAYFVSNAEPFLQDLDNLQFGSDGTVAYTEIVDDSQADSDETIVHTHNSTIICMRPIIMQPAEYLLILAAMHLEHNLVETEWREIFDQAPEQLKAFVRAKTKKFAQ